MLGDLPAKDLADRVSEGAPVSVCVRPGDFDVVPVDPEKLPKPPSDNRAYIRERRFLGETQQLDVIHSLSDMLLHVRCMPGLVSERVSEIEIRLNPKKTMIFPAESHGDTA